MMTNFFSLLQLLTGHPVAPAPADAAGTAALALPAGLPTVVYMMCAGNKALRLTVE